MSEPGRDRHVTVTVRGGPGPVRYNRPNIPIRSQDTTPSRSRDLAKVVQTEAPVGHHGLNHYDQYEFRLAGAGPPAGRAGRRTGKPVGMQVTEMIQMELINLKGWARHSFNISLSVRVADLFCGWDAVTGRGLGRPGRWNLKYTRTRRYDSDWSRGPPTRIAESTGGNPISAGGGPDWR